ncbi:MAG: hypothetical protein GXO30_01290 [Epsilonproteobacteria bacterium]|nr:hypothetical protein [Campylobacterota bacterium]
MPIINEIHTASSQITNLSKTIDKIIFSTKYDGVDSLSLSKCKPNYTFTHKDLSSHTLAVTFSKNGKRIAFSTKRYLYIADLITNEIIKKIDTQTKHLIILSFDNSSNYIIAGTKDARVMLYKYNSNLHISRLFSFGYKNKTNKFRNHFISSITYYKNFIAVGGHGGIIFIVDIYSQANKHILFHNTFLKTALLFLDTETILCGDNNGDLQFISICKNKVLKTIHLNEKKISQIKQIPNTNYLIIHANSKRIYIVDSKQKTLIHTKYIKFEDKINFLELTDKDTLIVALSNNKLLHVELPNTKRLKSLILHNSIDKAFKLIEDEPMLIGTDAHQELEKRYIQNYKRATEALINKNEKLAKEIMNNYQNVDSKKESIRLLFKAFENYHRFNILYLDKKYSICYAMSEKFPPLKLTKEHKNMERKWKETFSIAQKHISNNQINHAKNIFHEFIPVQSKRNLIHLMLMHNDLFIEFVKAINSKNFKVINEISKQNKLFLQMPIFKTLEENIQESIQEIKIYIKQNQLNKAKEALKKIENMPNFKQEIEELYMMCLNMQNLQDAYTENDFFRCYEIIDEYPHLQHSELGTLLHRHWFKLINRCENHAIKGSAREIKSTLGELIKLAHRRERIGSLLRLAFQVHILHLLSNHKFNNAKNLIYSYIDIFTKDTEIILIMDRYESISSKKLAITQIETTNKTRDDWVNSKIIGS